MTPSERIDQQIAELADWRAERVARIRAVVGAAEPALLQAAIEYFRSGGK